MEKTLNLFFGQQKTLDLQRVIMTMCEFIYNENMRWIETVGMCFGVTVAWSSHELLPKLFGGRMNRMNVCSFMLFFFGPSCSFMLEFNDRGGDVNPINEMVVT